MALSQVALAATLTVNSNADTPDATPGDGTCGAPGPGSTCTLRAAIQEANANPATSNEITFTASQTTTAATAYPAITKSLTVTGPANRFTVDGGAGPGVALFRYTGSGGTYAVSGVNFLNGASANNLGGGCIYFAPVGTASFTLSNSRINDCSSTGPGGGVAIDLLASGSSVVIDNVQVGLAADPITSAGPNTATGDGGGLWLRLVGSGSMTVTNSTFTGNTAANGGAIAVKRGRLDIDGSTLNGNSATGAGIGGGLYLDIEAATGGSVRMENVTISGNSAAQGGGIGAASNNPTASWVTFTTITGNTATTAASGGGIRAQASPGVTFPGTVFNPFTSNIVANNFSPNSGTTNNCAAAFSHSDSSNSGYNLTDNSSCGFSAANNDQIVANAAALKLAALAATPSTARQTHALQAGSPAIDAGNLNWVNATTFSDERGADAQDGNLDNSAGDPLRDIGAYEFGGFGLIQFGFPGAANNFDNDEDSSPALILIKRYGTGTAAATAPTVAFSTPNTPTPTATQGACGSGGADWTQLSSGATNFSFIGTAGSTQFDQTASITICNDQISDPNETFNLLLAKPATETVGYDLGPRVSGTVTIVETENGTFQFDPATASYSAPESNSGANGSVTLTIKRTVGSKGAVRVNYQTVTGSTCSPTCTATAGTDYTSANTFVDFADGEASKTITIAFIDDAVDEGNETFRVDLTSVSCQSLPAGRSCDARLVGAASHADRIRTVTINDDDAPVPGTLQLELGSYTVTETTTTLTIKVKRVGGKDGVVGVTYGATDGTATDDAGPNQDYIVAGNPPNTFTLSWADQNAADKTFDVTLINDSLRESDKTFTLNLISPTGGATLGTPNTAAVTLVSDEKPSFSFSAATYTVQESGPTVTLTVNSNCTPSPCFTGPDVSIPYYTTDGTATSPTDYTGVPQASPGTLTFSGADTTKTITITVANDTAVEGNETFTTTLGTPTNGGQVTGTNPATVTIMDPSAVRFTASSFASAHEGNASTITVTAERVGNLNGMISAGFTISQACTDPPPTGCATESVDYTRPGGFTGTLQWNDMEGGSKSFTITIIGDTLIEGNETIQVSLAAGMGSPAIGNSPATAVITDDDYRFEILDTSPLSVGEGAGNAAVQVRRIGSTVGAASVNYATTDGSAVAGADYTATASPPALIWNAGEGGNKSVSVPITDDTLDEPNETFTVSLSNPSNNASGQATSVSGSPLTVQIADNDAVTVSFSAASQTVGENAGTVTVTATRTGATTFDITVPYTVVGGTATNPADHNAASGSITILSGNTSGSTTFTVSDDALDEPNETVVFTMGTPTGGDVTAAAPTTHTVTITDNDAVTVSFSAAAQTVGENAGTVTVTATRTGATTSDITIPYTVSGTATNPADHNAANGSITILAGNSSGSANFSVINDAVDEANETVVFTMGTPSGGDVTAATPTTHTVTVTDNDTAGLTVTQLDGSTQVTEGGATDTFTVRLNSQPTANVTVTLSTGSEISVNPTTLTFTPANFGTAQTVTVTAVNDTTVENPETDSVSGSVASSDANYNGGSLSVTVSVTDNDSVVAGEQAPAVVVTQTGGSVNVAASGGGAFSWTGLLGLLGLLGLRWRRNLSALALLALTATPAAAGEFSYSYADLRYVTASVDEPSVDASGFSIAGSWLVGRQVFLSASYGTSETDDFTLQGVNGSSKSDTTSLGLGFRHPVRSGLDLAGVLSLISSEAQGQGGFTGSADDTGFGIEGGVRHSVSEKFEWGAAVSYVSIFDSDATSLNVQGLYGFSRALAGIFGAGAGDNSTQFNLGLRYTFATAPAKKR